MLEIAVVALQVLGGLIGLSAATAMVAGMWRESRLLTAAMTAVCVVVFAGLMVAGGGYMGANELVLGGLYGG